MVKAVFKDHPWDLGVFTCSLLRKIVFKDMSIHPVLSCSVLERVVFKDRLLLYQYCGLSCSTF